ncbi:hypothetical protein THASP1DRAFT_12632 [Thamnocephalis sphaerospora]|uniref:RING-type E3 ubiquitin transferase n=1 Tax=Thamnocephalis sphaerospora TaxID=78915 RepID=A0A4P9XY33_9FUNG|nr:hypothetical protein THASP1DRAFT_12632 [Thamnocephalis sphaerospora]|eukprot:RKP10601.1 hypothetical protein THASP1DRAFT_12632 [Thamnocephalis sphaerospora]
MSTTAAAAAAPASASSGPSGRNARGNERRKGKSGPKGKAPVSSAIASVDSSVASSTTSLAAAANDMAHDGLCFICTEPAKIFALGECNHRMCHVCALRLRALYKNKQCVYCKSDLEWVIFTEDPVRDYASFGKSEPACEDNGLGIKYQYRETFSDASSLLKLHCSKENCDFVAPHWGRLKTHAREEHHLAYCDLCVKNKKAFSHEHQLFTRAKLREHYHGSAQDKTSGFRGHPECSFCSEHFYDDDQLFEHCRDRHEQCHICVRSGAGRHDYYRNYAELEEHFRREHFPCLYKECLESKFVVFSTDIDLKAHEVRFPTALAWAAQWPVGRRADAGCACSTRYMA